MGLRRSFKPTNLSDNTKYVTRSSAYTLQKIDDYYRHINTGDFDRYNYILQVQHDIVANHKYYFNITARVVYTGSSISFNTNLIVGIGNTEPSGYQIFTSDGDNFVKKTGIVMRSTSMKTGFGVFMVLDTNGTSGHYIDVKEKAMLIDLTACLPADILALSDADLKAWCDLNIPVWFDGTLGGGVINGTGGLK